MKSHFPRCGAWDNSVFSVEISQECALGLAALFFFSRELTRCSTSYVQPASSLVNFCKRCDPSNPSLPKKEADIAGLLIYHRRIINNPQTLFLSPKFRCLPTRRTDTQRMRLQKYFAAPGVSRNLRALPASSLPELTILLFHSAGPELRTAARPAPDIHDSAN